MDWADAVGAARGPRILLIDNHDSFTWNLVHYLAAAGALVRVVRSDAIDAEGALSCGADGFVISPGPGRPEDAGISVALVLACAAQRRPLLGVCLGHQAIGAAFGGAIVRAPKVMHGKTSAITHDGRGVFAGLPSPYIAARYHSLILDPATLPDCLAITATADDGTLQGVRHLTLPIEGVQFHPESIASEHGHQLLANFVGQVSSQIVSAAG